MIDLFISFLAYIFTLEPFLYLFATLCFLGTTLLIKEIAQW